MKRWYVILDRIGKKEAWITTNPARYRKKTPRYRVWGPYNLASARFQFFGQ